MALIKYSALVQEARNKLNGSVLSKNRYGNYVRNKTTPVNPQTASQQNNRALLSAVSQAWGGLTASARQSFADLAENHPLTNIFGDRITLDGKAMFSKLAMNLGKIGLGFPTTAPVFVAVPFVEATGATASVASGLEIDLSVATVPAGFTMVVEATPALPATINFVKNRFRSIGTATAAASVADVTSAYNAKFGSLVAGDVSKVVHFRISLVSNTTGQVSLASEISAPVVATP